MRIRLTVPGEPNAETLGIALEAATRLAQHDMSMGDIPPIEDAIRQGIEWQPEPEGDESFDKPSTVLHRGWGDCDDLAPWLAAEMRETGFDGGASAIAIPSGHRTWHAIVKTSDGQLYDPSLWAGMPHDVMGTCAACSEPLNPGKSAIAIGARSVRVDMPGLQQSRGCQIGVSHTLDCEPNDEARVRALLDAIEDAIVTAQLARTGDKRAVKQLAVIYRVLRGDDLAVACNGVRLREDQVGLDFQSSDVRNWIRKAREILASAADEIFNGETWTAHDDRIVRARKVALSGARPTHRVGVIPCLAPLGPLAAAAATAGTLAAVVGPIALALQKMVGENTDFGRAMGELMKVTDKVKLVSVASAGLTGLMDAGIPAAWTQGASRWAELLQSPLAAAGVGTSTAQIANTMHWVEKNAALVLPPHIATKITPQVLDLLAESQKAFQLLKDGPKKAAEYVKKAFDLVRDETKRWLETLPKEQYGYTSADIEKLAEGKAAQFFEAIVSAAPPPIVEIHAPREIRETRDADFGGKTPERIVADAYAARFGPGDPRTIEKEQAALASELPELAPAVRMDDDPDPALATPGHFEAIDFVAAHIEHEIERENLRTMPVVVRVPTGWDPVFAMGCRQQTDECP